MFRRRPISPTLAGNQARSRPHRAQVLRILGSAAIALSLTACDPLDTVLTATPDTLVPDAALAQVVHVVDGDTADIRLDSGEQLRVRILGIDTPETVKPDTPVQCWGPEASEWARSVLDGAWVTAVSDPVAGDLDRYGRALRYLMLGNGTNYSELAAENGMARSYIYNRQNLTHTDDITDAEDRAHAAGLGLWGAPCHGQS